MKEKIGVFVSRSVFSKVAIDEIALMGYDVVCFSFGKKAGYQDEVVLDFGDIDGFVNYAYRYGIKRIVFAGKIDACSVFNEKMAESGKRLIEKTIDLNPENILKNLANFFVTKGIQVVPLTRVFKKYLAKEIIYSDLKPDFNQWNDISRGWRIAKTVARLGIGQAVAIKNGMVVSVEGIEGTDSMIMRTGNFCKDFVVVKVMKSGQDCRFDLPTIGPETVKNLISAGGKVLAVEAGKTVLVDQQEIIKIANENNLVVAGFKGKEIRSDN